MARHKTTNAKPKPKRKQQPPSKVTSEAVAADDPQPTDLEEEGAQADLNGADQAPAAKSIKSKKGKTPITQQQEDVQVAKRTLREILTQVETSLNTNSGEVLDFVAGLNAALDGPDELEGLAGTIAQGLDKLGVAVGRGGEAPLHNDMSGGLVGLLRGHRWKIASFVNNDCCKTIILTTVGLHAHAAPTNDNDGGDNDGQDYIIVDKTGQKGHKGSGTGAPSKRNAPHGQGGPPNKRSRTHDSEQRDNSATITVDNPVMSGALPNPPEPGPQQSNSSKGGWHWDPNPEHSKTAGTNLDPSNIVNYGNGIRSLRSSKAEQEKSLVRKAVHNVAAAASQQPGPANAVSAKGNGGKNASKKGNDKTLPKRALTADEKRLRSYNPMQSFSNIFNDAQASETAAAAEDETHDDELLKIGSLAHLSHAHIRPLSEEQSKGPKVRLKSTSRADKTQPTKKAEIVDPASESTEDDVIEDGGLGWEGVENEWSEEDKRADEEYGEEAELDVEKVKGKGGLKQEQSGGATSDKKRRRVTIAEQVEVSPPDIEAPGDEDDSGPQDPEARASGTEPAPYSIPPYRPTGYIPPKVKSSAKILSPRSSDIRRKSSLTAKSLYSQAKDDSNQADDGQSVVEGDADADPEPSGSSGIRSTGLSGGRNTRSRPGAAGRTNQPPTSSEESSSSGGTSHVSADSYQASGVPRPSLSECRASASARREAAVTQIDKYMRGEEEEREDEYVDNADAEESDGRFEEEYDDELGGK